MKFQAHPDGRRLNRCDVRGRLHDTDTASTVRVLFSRSRNVVHFDNDCRDVIILGADLCEGADGVKEVVYDVECRSVLVDAHQINGALQAKQDTVRRMSLCDPVGGEQHHIPGFEVDRFGAVELGVGDEPQRKARAAEGCANGSETIDGATRVAGTGVRQLPRTWFQPGKQQVHEVLLGRRLVQDTIHTCEDFRNVFLLDDECMQAGACLCHQQCRANPMTTGVADGKCQQGVDIGK